MKKIIAILLLGCVSAIASPHGSIYDPLYVVSVSTSSVVTGNTYLQGNTYFGTGVYTSTFTAATGVLDIAGVYKIAGATMVGATGSTGAVGATGTIASGAAGVRVAEPARDEARRRPRR